MFLPWVHWILFSVHFPFYYKEQNEQLLLLHVYVMLINFKFNVIARVPPPSLLLLTIDKPPYSFLFSYKITLGHVRTFILGLNYTPHTNNYPFFTLIVFKILRRN